VDPEVKSTYVKSASAPNTECCFGAGALKMGTLPTAFAKVVRAKASPKTNLGDASSHMA
jgi:hypothetical protein